MRKVLLAVAVAGLLRPLPCAAQAPADPWDAPPPAPAESRSPLRDAAVDVAWLGGAAGLDLATTRYGLSQCASCREANPLASSSTGAPHAPEGDGEPPRAAPDRPERPAGLPLEGRGGAHPRPARGRGPPGLRRVGELDRDAAERDPAAHVGDGGPAGRCLDRGAPGGEDAPRPRARARGPAPGDQGSPVSCYPTAWEAPAAGAGPAACHGWVTAPPPSPARPASPGPRGR